jgi:GNAT superfamily N-acetyltransferase
MRPLRHTDLAAALAIQSQSYPAFLREGKAAFASRLNLPDSYCLAATRDGLLIGYLLAYGWPGQAPSPVGAVLTKDAVSEVLFIHDLASLPEAQGSGIGRTLVMRAFELAALDGLCEAQLIAVEGAATYWRKLGFAEPIKGEMWFDVPDQPVFAVAGFWKQVGDHRGFTMVTCDPNELVAPIHPKAMITILGEEDWEKRMTCSYDEVVQLQRPYPAEQMTMRGPEFPTRGTS